MMISTIFFDLDRTLWDFETNSEVTLRQLYSDFNLKKFIPSQEVFLSTYREKNKALWALYRKGCLDSNVLKQKRFYETFLAYGIDKPELAQTFGRAYLEKLATQKQLFPGTIELLDYLFPKYPLYILTNGFKEVQHKKLKNINLKKYFTGIFTSDEIGYPKPNPEFFSFVLDKISAKPEHCIMVGDDLQTDILGAKNMSIKGIYFNPDEKPHQEIVDYEITRLLEIKKIL
ncbi:MAG: YjjG family noncanonical pyrimidine nucleotidase [Bacteroidales bacterium]|nr:YjjG family noncanonical pyrimidine nucleotidase [Bacteroidales bacterium]